MNATTLPSKTESTLHRLSDWAVIFVTLIAVLAGWLIKTGVQNRSVSFASSGISAQTPEGWLSSKVQGNEILHVTDPLSTGFGTTYTIENIPVATDITVDQVVSSLTLQRGQSMNSFRVLKQQAVTIAGRVAYEISYVYVESNPNLTHNEIPNIVQGLDYVFLNGDHAIVATFWADENEYASDLARFQLFLSSLKF
ncbi:MAG: hypothetical protein ACXWNC_06965 [Anaerolineales bacterium]